MSKIQAKIECTRCGNDLDEEEMESPQEEEGDVICDECYHEHYEFTCCCCCNYGHVDDRHKMLVVFETCDAHGYDPQTGREVWPGIYRITGGPYHGGYLVGGSWLYEDRLERIADLNPDMGGDGYPCGHLCADCQAKIKAQFVAKCSGCGLRHASCLRVKVGHWHNFDANDFRWSRPKTLCSGCRHKVHQWKLSHGQV